MTKIANRQIFIFFFDFLKKNMSGEYGHMGGTRQCADICDN